MTTCQGWSQNVHQASSDSILSRLCAYARDIPKVMAGMYTGQILLPASARVLLHRRYEYQMIQDGDRVAVCSSSGKDSMVMAKLFQELFRPVIFAHVCGGLSLQRGGKTGLQ